ncbi:hypothetical protein [Kibdelosporangium aridum]|uniref:hypothetical protein n=1 Tax=Kibdelosporangium aridum TaxID=2030 RepID=UPI000525B9ED
MHLRYIESEQGRIPDDLAQRLIKLLAFLDGLGTEVTDVRMDSCSTMYARPPIGASAMVNSPSSLGDGGG